LPIRRIAMMRSDRLEGLQVIARYYQELIGEGRWDYVNKFLSAQRKLYSYMESQKEKEHEVTKVLTQAIRCRIKHNEARLLWKKDINFDNMSHAARGFSAGQASSWVSEIYFLKGLLEKLDE
jgi:hypothetical protein